MSSYQPISISRSGSQDPALGPDTYWLRFGNDEEDDLATTEDVTEILENLYNIDPCVDTGTDEEQAQEETEEAEPPADPLELFKAARSIWEKNLSACRAALAGNYTATVKIYRSHPREPYKLVLSAGEVTKTVISSEAVNTTINIQSASSVELEYPVVGGMSAGWLGLVIGENGAVSAPEIKRQGNRLYWAGSITGTIRVIYTTTVDVVTVDVQGVPFFDGSDGGEAQDVKILAFYHLMVFEGQINKPAADETITPGALKQICGYNNTGTLDTIDDKKPLPIPPPDDDAEYGCLTPSPYLSLASTYKELCCEVKQIEACLLYTARHTGGIEIDQETARQLQLLNPRTSFRPVSPAGAEGCGTKFFHLKVAQKNCCAETEPLSASPENPATMQIGVKTRVCFIGGESRKRWRVTRGTFPDGRTEKYSSNQCEEVVAIGCMTVSVTVSDNCTSATAEIAVSGAQPLQLVWQEQPVAPGAIVMFYASGGVPPYTGWNSDKLIYIGDGTDGIFEAPADFCGTANVSVNDQCMATESVPVQSTNGYWELVPEASLACAWQGASSAGATKLTGKDYEVFTSGYWLRTSIGNPPDSMYCNPGHSLGSLESYCADLGGWREPGIGCCLIRNEELVCIDVGEFITYYYQWSCNE